MAGGDRIGSVGGQAATKELVELDVLVAGLARVRGRAVEVGVDEGVDHARAELALDVQDEERDAEDLGDAARVVGGIRRAARAAELVALGQVGVGAHPDADDLVVRGGLAGRGARQRRTSPPRRSWRQRSGSCAGDHLRCEARSRGSTACEGLQRAIDVGGASSPGRVVMRSEPWASSGSMPIASSTWLGSVLPEVQALPVEASTPSRSSAATRSPPSTPSITTLTLFGSRSVSVAGEAHAVDGQQPVDEACAELAKPIGLGRHRGAGEREGARRTRRSPATFSVPARRCRSCEPPWSCGSMCVPRRTKSAPTPCGPPSLWAERLTRSACQASTSIGACAANWTASTWKRRRMPAHDLPDLGDRLDRADLVVGGHDADERRALGERSGHGDAGRRGRIGPRGGRSRRSCCARGSRRC